MRIGITHRFVFSVCAFLAPMAVLFYFNLDQVSNNIHFVSQEIEGNQYQRVLVALMGDVTQHGLLAGARVRQPGKYDGELAPLTAEIARQFDALAEIERRNERDLQFTAEDLNQAGLKGLRANELKAKWAALLADSNQTDGEAIGKKYQELTGDLRSAISHVSDTSNLSLDPEMDSYFLSDIISNSMPEQIASQFSSQTYLASLIGKPTLAPENKTELVVFARTIKSFEYGRMVGDLDGALKENLKSQHGPSATLKPSLEQVTPAYKRDVRALIALLNGVNGGKPIVDDELVATYKAALQSSLLLSNAASVELEGLLQKRSDDFAHYRLKLTALTLVALAIASIVFILVLRSIVTPLKRLEATMKRLSQNDLDLTVPYLGKQDEIGQMAASVDVFRQNGLERVELERQARQAERTAELEKQKALRDLVDNFEGNVQGAIDSISSTSTMLDSAAQQLQQVMQTVASQSDGVSGASEDTAEHVNGVSDSVSQISKSSEEIAQKISQSATVVGNTVENMREADRIANSLTHAVGEIRAVLQLIHTIAGQTNLLALNATIEAARAGDAGKGFAVVASEVKSLASQTSKATDEIANNIQSVEKASEAVINIVRLIQGSINDISDFSKDIASAAEEQSVMTLQISDRMLNATQRVNQITTSIAAVTQGVSHADRTSHDVLSAVQALSQQSDVLNVQVQKFLGGLRN